MGVFVPVINIPGNAATATSASQATKLANDSGSAPSYGCRAWVNFNGTGTVAIRASGNVSSITDYAVGDYAVNFTTSMTDANYAVTGTVAKVNAQTYARNVSSNTDDPPGVATCRIKVTDGSGSLVDNDRVSVAFFR